MDRNVELESIKFLEINTGENVYNRALGNVFLEHERPNHLKISSKARTPLLIQ